MDRVGADFFRCVRSIKERLNATAVPMTLPIGAEDSFRGVIDLVKMKAYEFDEETQGLKMTVQSIPAELAGQAKEAREKMIEEIASHDDLLAEKYLGVKPISEEEILAAARRARKTDPNEPFSALAFKIMTDPFVGTLTYFRVYSGTLEAGSYVYNSTKDKKERIGRLLQMHANRREEVKTVVAGDIAAVVGLKYTTTGDTLCDEGKPIVLEAMEFPDPVISVAIEPKTQADQEKLSISLGKLATEDPSFRVKVDHETGQTIISGMGELHLEIIVDRMMREFKVGANVGKPQVAYRETLMGLSEAEGKYIRQTGGRGQYCHVWLKVEPMERGKGFEFVDKIAGGVIPREFIPAVKKGIEEALETGILAGYPMVDVRCILFDGSFHDVDSSEIAFKLAGSIGFKEACKKAGVVLLEPIMKIEVTAPEDYVGAVTGDLNSRRGRIVNSEIRTGTQIIDAQVPLARMFGYATDLRSLTQGRAIFTMEFSHYEQVPKNIAEEIVAKVQGR